MNIQVAEAQERVLAHPHWCWAAGWGCFMAGWASWVSLTRKNLVSCYETWLLWHQFCFKQIFSLFLCQDCIKVRRGLIHGLWDLGLRDRENVGLVSSYSKACFIILQSLREADQFLTQRTRWLVWILVLRSGTQNWLRETLWKRKWVRSLFWYLYELLTSWEAFDDNLVKLSFMLELGKP